MNQNNQAFFNPNAHNTEIIKNYFNKPIVLARCILHAASIVISIISAYVASSFASDFIEEIVDKLNKEIPSEFNSIIEVSSSKPDFFSILTSMTLPILTVVAFAIIYFKCSDAKATSTPKAGFTIMYVISIINLIAVSIAVGALALCLIAVLFLSGSIANDVNAEGFLAAVIIMIVVFTIFCTLLLIFAINQRNYYKSIKDGLNGMPLTAKGASTFAAFCTFFGVMSILGIIGSISSLIMNDALGDLTKELTGTRFDIDMGKGVFISILSSIVTAAIYFIDAKLAREYSNHINNANAAYTPYQGQPIASQAFSQPYAPQNYNQQTPYSYQPQPTDTFADDKTASVAQQFYCPYCGNTVSADTTFCGSCGSKLK